jgi:hypothetical protein
MEIYTNTYRFTILPNTTENIIPNMFVNATLKTFGAILCAQGLYYIYWKRNFDYINALRYLDIRRMLAIPFALFWYWQLRLEFNKLKVDKTIVPLEPKKEVIPEPIKVVEIPKPKEIKVEEKKVVVAPKVVEPKVEEKKIEPVREVIIQTPRGGKRISLNYIIY